MALTKQQLLALNNSSFPNNNAGYITPELLRTYNSSSIGAFVDEIDYTIDSASVDLRLDNLENFSSSLVTNFATVAYVNGVSASLTSTASFNAYTQSTNNTINGLATTSSVNQLTASINSVSSSVGLLQTFSGSQYKADSASFSSRIISAENTGYVTTASFNSYTQSTDTKINSLNTISASYLSFTQSYYSDSASFDGRLDATATTGSNTFNGNQIINGNVSASSFVSASKFIGDGSQLTGVTASVSIAILDEGVYQGNATSLNFTGSGLTASVVAGVALIQAQIDQSVLNQYTLTSSFNSFTQSYQTDSASFNSRINAVDVSGYVSTSSFNAYTQSTNQFTASISTSVGLLQTFSASSDSRYVQNSQTSSMAVSSSLYAVTSSYAVNGGVTQILAGPNITVSPLSGKGQVTISSTGTGSGNFNTATGSYGSFYDTTTQPNPVANTANSMSFNETAITNGVSISGSTNPFNTYIKTENAGVYNLQFSAQLDKTDSGTDSIDIWIRKNGIDLLDTGTTVTLTGNNDKSVAAWNWFVQSAANDYYQIIWASADTDMRLLAEVSSSVHPGIPSVIATINRVDQFLSNTGSFTGSFNGYNLTEFTTTSSFNAFTQSISSSVDTISSSVGLLQTFSSSQYKNDSSSFDSRINAIPTVNTGSFATTGSNTFNGNQTINGVVSISSSATYDLDITGGFQATGASRVSGSNGIANIQQTLVSVTSGSGILLQSFTGARGYMQVTGDGNVISIYARPSTIGGFTDGAAGGGFALKNLSNANYYPIQFQSTASFTDGRVTFTTPISASAGIVGDTSLTGSLILSSSNAVELNVIGNSIITGSLILSSSIPTELQVIGGVEITGSVAGNITALTVASSTASIDFNLGTFFTLTIPSSSVTYITGSNLKPGMTANIVLTQQATTGSVRFESSLFKFPSGSINTGSAVASAVDIVSVMSVNTTTLLSVGANRLI